MERLQETTCLSEPLSTQESRLHLFLVTFVDMLYEMMSISNRNQLRNDCVTSLNEFKFGTKTITNLAHLRRDIEILQQLPLVGRILFAVRFFQIG